MELLWDALSVLFFFSLVMLAASVFTEKTAWFFKEKSKLRGAILWMSVTLVCAVLVNEFSPRVVVPELAPQVPAASANATQQ